MKVQREASRRRRSRLVGVIAAAAIAVGVVVGLTLAGLHHSRAPKDRSPSTGWRLDYPVPEPATAAVGNEGPRIPPWEATPENTPDVPEGHIPAWVVKPPPPDPNMPAPPPAREWPDPAAQRTPLHDPRDMNGNRRARPIPGIGYWHFSSK